MGIGSQTDKQADEAFRLFSKAVCRRYGEKPFTAASITSEVPEAKKDREMVNKWIGRAMSSNDITHAREQPPGTFCFTSTTLKVLRKGQSNKADEEQPVEVRSIMPPPVKAPSKNPENCQGGTLGDAAEVQEFFVLLIYSLMGVGLLNVIVLQKAVMNFRGWEKTTPEVFEQILKRLVALFVLEKKGGTYGLSGPSAVRYAGMTESFARELKMRFPPVAAAVYLPTPLVPEPVPVPDPEPPRPPIRAPRLIIVEPPPAPPVEEPVAPAEDTTVAVEVPEESVEVPEVLEEKPPSLADEVVELKQAERALRKAERRSGQLGIALITSGVQQFRRIFASQEVAPSVFENLKGKIENQRRYLKSAEARQIWAILQDYPCEFWWAIVVLFENS